MSYGACIVAAALSIASMTPVQARRLVSYESYCHNVWTIPTKGAGWQPFVWNQAQRHIHAAAQAQWQRKGFIRLNCGKARQMGNSTYWNRRAFHYVLTHPARQALLLADKLDTPAEWLGLCQHNYDETPVELRPAQTQAEAGHQMKFANGSRLYIGSAQGGFPGVGGTVSFLVLSEVGWWDKAPISKDPDTLLQPLAPAIPTGTDMPGTVVVRDSTGVMRGDWWSRQWDAAKRGETEYENVFVPWFLIDTYRRDDLTRTVAALSKYEAGIVGEASRAWGVEIDAAMWAWWRTVCLTEFNGDAAQMKAAYPANEDEMFMSPGELVYEAVLDKLRDRPWDMGSVKRYNVCVEGNPFTGVTWLPSATGEYIEAEGPHVRLHYVLGADCQWGRRRTSDYDCLHVECLETGRCVARLMGRFALHDWGRLIAAVGHRYNDALVAPESNTIEGQGGEAVLAILLGQVESWRYPNVYVDMAGRDVKPTIGDYGFRTDMHSKPRMIALSLRGTAEGSWHWGDPMAAQQAGTIIRHDDGSVGSPVGSHDDAWMSRLITGAVAHQVRPYTDLALSDPVVYQPVRTMEQRFREMAGEEEVADGSQDEET